MIEEDKGLYIAKELVFLRIISLVIFFVFLTLKITNVVNWSWFIIIIPLFYHIFFILFCVLLLLVNIMIEKLISFFSNIINKLKDKKND